MAFTQQQLQQAANSQDAAAHDQNPVVRTLAGPGAGKSRTIAERVNWLLLQNASAAKIFVISFTRATATRYAAPSRRRTPPRR